MLTLLSAMILQTLFGIAGGGGSSSGGGGGGGSFSGGSSSGSGGGGDGGPFDIAVVFLVTGGLVAFFIFGGIQSARAIKAKRDKVKRELAVLAANDVVWEQGKMETRAKELFIQYQKDWSSFDLDSMKTYMTPEYYQHNLLMMGAMKMLNRQNDVQSPSVLSAEIFNYQDNAATDNDLHTVQMSVFVHDVLKDTEINKNLYAKNLSATEYYKFRRSGDAWQFAGIDQATASPAMMNNELRRFAHNNQYFYSADWGYLLLPQRGQLFKGGNFGVSDINNHVIGLYNDIIIQLYTYVPAPSNASTSYLIAQTSVPKRYGNIVVRKKAGWFAGGTKGLRKIQMEWSDFNTKYEVFASDQELATSFELLNPSFMEKLEALSIEVNIEVVDNIVYLYTPEKGIIKPENYQTLLSLLKDVFKEMKM